MAAYRLRLSTGSAWAIAGSPDRVIPLVLKDSAYSPTASLLFRSGPYVLFFPEDVPEAFYTHLGPIPGMAFIDSDLYR
jgi:hypothetical protein